jgi:cytochrome P450 family 144
MTILLSIYKTWPLVQIIRGDLYEDKAPMAQAISASLLLDRETIQDPYAFYRELQAEAPVWRVPGTEIFVVTSFAMLTEAALRVEDFSSNMRCFLYRDENGLPARLNVGDYSVQALASADPPVHTAHKRAVFPKFVEKRMALLEPEIIETTARLTEAAVAKDRFDFMAEVGNRVPISVISQLIGFRDSDLDTLLQSAFDSASIVAGTTSQEELVALMMRSGNIREWIAGQIDMAKERPGEDILTSIGQGVASGALEADVALIILQILLSAGGESTTSLLGNAVGILARNQDLQEQLRRQPDRVPAFIEEALRLEAPFRHMLRYAPKATVLGGVDIPAGATVLLFWGAGNRDPSVFENPDELIFDRPLRHLTFGRGIHQCVGAPLARLEGKVVLTVLLERTRSFMLDPDRPPLWANSLQARRYQQLPLQLTAR